MCDANVARNCLYASRVYMNLANQSHSAAKHSSQYWILPQSRGEDHWVALSRPCPSLAIEARCLSQLGAPVGGLSLPLIGDLLGGNAAIVDVAQPVLAAALFPPVVGLQR